MKSYLPGNRPFAIMCMVVVVVLVWPSLTFRFVTRTRQIEFRREWTQKLKKCRTIADVHAIGKATVGEIDVRTFNDGSWIAVAWHCSHDEDDGLYSEWDQDVFLDSAHHIYWSDHHFCGYEGLSGEFLNPFAMPAKSASEYFVHACYKSVRVR